MITNMTYADILQPSNKKLALLYNSFLIITGSFVIALSAQIAIQLPFSPVPVTAQTLAVLMVGACLGAKRGSLCVLLYLLEGFAGLPVFTMARGGFHVLLGPTGGYLIGFVPAAYITGLLAQHGWDKRVWTTILAMVFGNIAIYTFGLVWLYFLMAGDKNVLAIGLYPFMIGEVLKVLLAATVLPLSWNLLKKCKLPTA